MTLAEPAARVESRSTPAAYLYDCSLPLKVPQLCERVGVPAYFSHVRAAAHALAPCILALVRERVFCGRDGHAELAPHRPVEGPLLDGAAVSGAKRWTIFHPDDAWCLSPSWDAAAPRLEPIFPSLDEMEASPEQYPLLRLARRVDLTLRAGEVLLVPGGAPHRVRNGASDGDGDVSVAIAANFVDASNCAAAVADLKLMARRADGAEEDPGAAAAAAGLDELDPDAFADDDAAAAERVGVPPPARRVVPYSEYAKGCGGDVARMRETCYWLEEERRRRRAIRRALPHTDATPAAPPAADAPLILLVHGWLGDRRDLGPLQRGLCAAGLRCVAVDLPGHGDAAAIPAGGGGALLESLIATIDALVPPPRRVALVGYSLGGRLVMQAARRLGAARVAAVVALCASPGIEDEAARERRRLSDGALAAQLRVMDAAAFGSWLRGEWYAAALWGGALQTDGGYDAMVRRRLDGVRPAARAAALEDASVGAQQPLWEWLRRPPMPVLYVAGADDASYSATARRLAAAADVRVAVVDGAGHAVLLQAAAAVLAECRAFLGALLPPAAPPAPPPPPAAVVCGARLVRFDLALRGAARPRARRATSAARRRAPPPPRTPRRRRGGDRRRVRAVSTPRLSRGGARRRGG